ncbi:KTSC domain-containing protein [Mucilaginibacter lappiensis]|uniref:KTSC domain-containing protein n=1 Tax=Mucilaginibacter lappiensis TaxID=354630 RepID=A0ABR6PEY8_9SPHI|nr:KTSC domain-containing protein [Mucilaginibacter lappiensis]MBB6107804.1 hypothetical protein [Mucilaginibacter lappiensis]SIP96642.1 KTSC domain-containing protein [Mucilaginibacter lappiensis]
MPSAVIAAYEYDKLSETLTIQYHSGKIYNYLNVPEKVFREMRSTMVKGIWFNRHIKGKYPFEEVTPGLKQNNLFDQSK